MEVRVEILRLNTLADDLGNLQKDIRSLVENAVSASEDVLKRVSGSDYAPLSTARTKAQKAATQVKDLKVKVCDRLTQQSGILREAAYSYREKDTITRVN